MFVKESVASFQAAGGIVSDSDETEESWLFRVGRETLRDMLRSQ